MRFLKQDSTPLFEAVADDAAFEGSLVSVGRHQPARVPGNESGSCVRATDRETIEEIAQGEREEAGPSSAQGRQVAVKDKPEG